MTNDTKPASLPPDTDDLVMRVPPSQMPDLVRWSIWAMPGEKHDAAQSVFDRECWFFADHAVCEELAHARRSSDGLPVLAPEDLIRPDGIVLHESTTTGQLSLTRWVSTPAGCIIVRHLIVSEARMQFVIDEECRATGDEPKTLAPLPVAPDMGINLHWGVETTKYTAATVYAIQEVVIPVISDDGSPFMFCGVVVTHWPWGARVMSDDGETNLAVVDERTVSGDWHIYADPDDMEFPSISELAATAAQPPLVVTNAELQLCVELSALWAHESKAVKDIPMSKPERRKLARRTQKVRGEPLDDRVRFVSIFPTDGGSGRNVDSRARSRRHLVRGHWRRQWHPSLDTHRQTWIRAHLRGGTAGDTPAAPGTRTVYKIEGDA